MGASNQTRRRYRSAWAVFAFFVALPSVVLAFAGLRTFSAAEIERADALRRRADFIARDANDSLIAALGRMRTADPSAPIVPGVTRFRRDSDGALSFPEHRVYVADFGVVPASLSPVDRDRGNVSGIPDAIVSASVARSQTVRRTALAQLRAGSWWLHLDQRRAYDAELVRRLVASGAADLERSDPRLDRLAQVQATLALAVAAGPQIGAVGVPTRSGTALIVWSSDGRSDGSSGGVVIDPADTMALIRGALDPRMTGPAQAVDIQDRRGAEVWRLNEHRVPDDTSRRPLSAVDGWTLAISPAARESDQSLWAYGFVVLPVAVLAFGLVMTTRVVRREVALARRQAEFTAAVTHEFKSPITSLRLLMERIASGRVAGGAALAEYHDAITRETDRLDALVNRLLDVQQIQAGRRNHNPVPAPIAPLIGAAINRLQPQAEAKRIQVRSDLPADSIECPLDRNSVSDALDNLIDNAIKYSASGTIITVTARRANDQLELEVRDQGAGIHRDDLPHVFEPYYRGRLGDSQSVRGTGLGLALVQAAATAHGGRVDVTSARGEGSCFTMRLPLGVKS